MIDADAVEKYLMDSRAIIDMQKRRQNMHYRNGEFEKGNAAGLALETLENEYARFQAWADRTFLNKMRENQKWENVSESPNCSTTPGTSENGS